MATAPKVAIFLLAIAIPVGGIEYDNPFSHNWMQGYHHPAKAMPDRWNLTAVLNYLKAGGDIEKVHRSWTSNPHVAMTAVKHVWTNLFSLDDKLKGDVPLVKAAVRHEHADQKWRQGERDIQALRWSRCKGLIDDKKFMMDAVCRNGKAFEYATLALREDKELALAAVRQRSEALEFAGPTMQDNKDVVLTAVRESGLALKFAGQTMKGNKEVVLAAVLQYGAALQYADPALQDDEDVVLAAVHQQASDWDLNPFESKAFHFAGPTMRGNKVVVLAAVRLDAFALTDADPALRGDKDVALAAVRNRGWILKYVVPALQEDKDVVLAAVGTTGKSLEYVVPAMKSNKDVVLAAVRQDGAALRYAIVAMNEDKDVVLAAVRQDGSALRYAIPAMQEDKEVVLAAVGEATRHSDEPPLRWAGPTMKRNKDVVLAAARQDRISLRYAVTLLQDDEDVLELHVMQVFAFKANRPKQLRVEVGDAASRRVTLHIKSETMLGADDADIDEAVEICTPSAPCKRHWMRKGDFVIGEGSNSKVFRDPARSGDEVCRELAAVCSQAQQSWDAPQEQHRNVGHGQRRFQRARPKSGCPFDYKCCAAKAGSSVLGETSICVGKWSLLADSFGRSVGRATCRFVPAWIRAEGQPWAPPEERWTHWDKVYGASECHRGSPMFSKRIGGNGDNDAWQLRPGEDYESAW